MRAIPALLGFLLFAVAGHASEREVPAACVELARLANSSELALATDRMYVAAREVTATSSRPRAAIAFVDVDGDGLEEFVSPGDIGPHYVHADGSTPVIRLDPALAWDPGDDDYVELTGALSLDEAVYLLFARQGDLAHASTYRNGSQQLVCSFDRVGEPARIVALTRYEALVQAARRAGLGPWEFAIKSPGTHHLETLSAARIPTNDSGREYPLLVQAFSAGRLEVFDWLLAHGADPNAGRDEYSQPLFTVLWSEDFARAIAVIRAGGVPGRVAIEKIAEILLDKPEAPGDLALATAEQLRVVPEAILIASAQRPRLFDALIATGLPVRPDWWEWHAGVRIAMRPDAAEEYAKHPGALEKARGAYAKLAPPINHHAAVSFGDGTKGWRFQLAGVNPMPHEELLLFATAFCVYFLPEDCGPPDLQRRAEAWARGLSNTCTDRKLAEKYEHAPCNTVVYYNMVVMPNSPKPMFLLPTGTNWGPRTYSIEAMYRAKQRSPRR